MGNALNLQVVILPMFIAEIWPLFEAFYLNKLIHIHRFGHRHLEIDDIRGGA